MKDSGKKSRRRLTDVLLVVMFFSLFLCNLIQVFFRYVMQASLVWSEELARCLFLWSVYFGMALVTRDKEHIVIDILSEVKGKDALIRVINIIAKIITIIISCVLLALAIQYSVTIIERHLVTPVMQLPLWVPVSSIVVGVALNIYYLVRQLFSEFTEAKKTRADEGVKT